jgi:hypothetical protein
VIFFNQKSLVPNTCNPNSADAKKGRVFVYVALPFFRLPGQSDEGHAGLKNDGHDLKPEGLEQDAADGEEEHHQEEPDVEDLPAPHLVASSVVSVFSELKVAIEQE